MVIGLVGGTMDLLWMGGATLLMTLEKLPDNSWWPSQCERTSFRQYPAHKNLWLGLFP
jgi:predicted metal-binding membrane protein